MILHLINGIAGLLLGAFALSNVVLPYTVTVPALRRLKADGVLIRDVPAVLVHTSPAIWTLLCAVGAWVYRSYFPAYLPAVGIGFGVAFIGVLVGTFRGATHRDISADLVRGYGEYLDMEKLRAHPLFTQKTDEKK